MIAATVTLGFHRVFMPDYAQAMLGKIARHKAMFRANSVPKTKQNSCKLADRSKFNQ
jgi:hypothetical protein